MTATSGRSSPPKSGSVADIAADSLVSDVLPRHPSTALILLQRGRLFRVRPGDLYPAYTDPLTLQEFAAINGVDLEPFLNWLRRSAEEGGRSAGAGTDYELPDRRAP